MKRHILILAGLVAVLFLLGTPGAAQVGICSDVTAITSRAEKGVALNIAEFDEDIFATRQLCNFGLGDWPTAGELLDLNGAIFKPTTVSVFPVSPTTDDYVIVLDDSAAGACDSAGGTATTGCRWTGTVWEAVGDGGVSGTFEYSYRFDTDTDNTPVTGRSQINNANPTLATELYLHEVTDDGQTPTLILNSISDGDLIGLLDRNGVTAYIYQVDGVPSLSVNVYTFPVAVLEADAGDLLADNERVLFRVQSSLFKFFTDLLDTPDTYSGSAALFVKVNGAEDGLEFVAGTGGAVGFDEITSGTNVAAAMVVGSGATISATGTGAVEATTAEAFAVSGNITMTSTTPTVFMNSSSEDWKFDVLSGVFRIFNTTDVLSRFEIGLAGDTTVNPSGSIAGDFTWQSNDNSVAFVCDASADSGAGRCAMGTATPEHTFDVQATVAGDATLQVKTTSGEATLYLDAGGANNDAEIILQDDDTDRFKLYDDTSLDRFCVESEFATNFFLLCFDHSTGAATFNENGTSTAVLRVEGDNDPNLLVTDPVNDRVGIGTASPDAIFHVAGTGNVLPILESTASGAVQLIFKTDSVNRRFLAQDGAGNLEVQIVFGDNGKIEFLGPTANDTSFAIAAGVPDDALLLQSTGTLVINETGVATADLRVESDTNVNMLVVDASANAVGIGTGTPSSTLEISGFLELGVNSELTISGGIVTAVSSRHTIDTEVDAATDDLDTINGCVDGRMLYLHAIASTRTVVLKDNIGNLRLAGDFSLDHANDQIMLTCSGTTWREVSRSDNDT